GGALDSNGWTSITVTGPGNTVAIRETTMQGGSAQPYGLRVLGGTNNSSFTMSRSTIKKMATTCLYVDQFATFNGGGLDGGGVIEIYNCFNISGYNIDDNRALAGNPMTFADTTIASYGGLDAGKTLDSTTAPSYGIHILSPQNQMVFY